MSDVSIRYTSKSRQDNTENSQIPFRNKLATSVNEQKMKTGCNSQHKKYSQ